MEQTITNDTQADYGAPTVTGRVDGEVVGDHVWSEADGQWHRMVHLMAPDEKTLQAKFNSALTEANITDQILEGLREKAKRYDKPIHTEEEYAEARRARNEIAKVVSIGKGNLKHLHDGYVWMWKKSNEQKKIIEAKLDEPKSIINKHIHAYEEEQHQKEAEALELQAKRINERFKQLQDLGCTRKIGDNGEDIVSLGDAVFLVTEISSASDEVFANIVRSVEYVKAELDEAAKAEAERQAQLAQQAQELQQQKARLDARLASMRRLEMKAAGAVLKDGMWRVGDDIAASDDDGRLAEYDDATWEGILKQTKAWVEEADVKRKEREELEAIAQEEVLQKKRRLLLQRERKQQLLNMGCAIWYVGEVEDGNMVGEFEMIGVRRDKDNTLFDLGVNTLAELSDERWESELLAAKGAIEERDEEAAQQALIEWRVELLKVAGWEVSEEDGRLELCAPQFNPRLSMEELVGMEQEDFEALLTTGREELARRKAVHEKQIAEAAAQAERERIAAAEQAQAKAEADRKSRLSDAEKWNEWIEAIRASAPTLTSDDGIVAVDYLLRFIADYDKQTNIKLQKP